MATPASRQSSEEHGQSAGHTGDDGQDKGLAILDFLFTFSLGGGLVPEALGRRGLLSEPWITSSSWPSLEEFGHVLTLVFAVLTLTFSWYGYHESIRLRPHRAGTWQGFTRFQIDILLVLLYGVLLLLLRRIDWALTVSAVIYGLYALWDWMEASEYGEEFSFERGRMVSVVGLVLFATLCAATWLLPIPAVMAATVAIILSVSYRIAKIKLAGHGMIA